MISTEDHQIDMAEKCVMGGNDDREQIRGSFGPLRQLFAAG